VSREAAMQGVTEQSLNNAVALEESVELAAIRISAPSIHLILVQFRIFLVASLSN